MSVDVPTFQVPGLGPSTEPSNAPPHLTLKFLGEVPDDRVGEIGRTLERSLHGASAFPVTLRGLGAFPSASRPRVLWVGISEGAALLGDLARRTDGGLAGLGFPVEDRPFTAHVTVRRIRPGSPTATFRGLIERHRETVFASGWVRSVDLKSSLLTSEGARHTTLARFPLGPALA